MLVLIFGGFDVWILFICICILFLLYMIWFFFELGNGCDIDIYGFKLTFFFNLLYGKGCWFEVMNVDIVVIF